MAKRRTRPAPAPKPVARDPEVVVFRGDGRQPWRFRVVAGNGEIVATSEGYFSKWNATRAAKKLGLPVSDAG